MCRPTREPSEADGAAVALAQERVKAERSRQNMTVCAPIDGKVQQPTRLANRPMHRMAHQPDQVVGTRAGVTLQMLHIHIGHSEAQPFQDVQVVAVRLWQAQEGIHHLAGQQ